MTFAELHQSLWSFQEPRLLLTAVELDLFTAVGTGAAASEVAARLKTDPRATEVLLNALAAIGALTKQEGIFRNTAEMARYLVAGSADYARPALMHDVNMWTAWSSLTDCVRTGAPPAPPGTEAGDSQWTESFIAAMHRGAVTAAQDVVTAVDAVRVRRMLDVGGGSGAHSIAFAQANPELRAEVLDLETVVSIARKHIDEAGLSDRVRTRVGDLKAEDFGSGYDLVLLSRICHMLSPEENQDLFRRAAAALTPGGRLVIRDFILEPDKTAPKEGAIFAVHMLLNTRGGSNYSGDEYRSWLSAAQFREITRHSTSPTLLIATR